MQVCYATATGDYPLPPRCPPLPRLDFEDAMQWGRMLFGDVRAGASAWIYWNMVLDTRGGPWLSDTRHANPDPNPQQPLIVADPQAGIWHPTGAYYALAHFSKFVRPGARLVLDRRSSAVPATVHSAAFLLHRADGSAQVVLQLMNDSPEPAEVLVAHAGRAARVALPPISLTTLRWAAGR